MVFGAFGRCLILAINIAFLFGVSLFTEKKLGLQKTATTFWNLGLCLTPLIILTLSVYGALGDYFSFNGDGRFLLGIATSLLMIGLTQLSFKKFNQSLFLMIRHGFEMLTQGFAWFWLGASLGLSPTEQVYLSFIGWGLLLGLESLCLHESISPASISTHFKSIASPYLIEWLPRKHVIFQWGTLLLTLQAWIDFSYYENQLGWVLGFTLLLVGFFALSPQHQRTSLSYCYPLGLQLLLLGNLMAMNFDSSIAFQGLNLLFLAGYFGLTYLSPTSSLQASSRQCLRANVIFYFGSQAMLTSFGLSVDFFLNWIVLGSLCVEGLLRHRLDLPKGSVYYGLSAIWGLFFGILFGLNADLSVEWSTLLGTSFTLILQTIWLWLYPSYRSIGSEGGFLITLTTFTLSFISVMNGFLFSLISLILLGGMGFILFLKLSLQTPIKPWIFILLMTLNLIASNYQQLLLIYPIALVSLILLGVIKGKESYSDSTQKMISLLTWLLRLNSLLLTGMIFSCYEVFKGLLSAELLALTISMGLDYLQAKNPKEKTTFTVITLYLFSFFLNSLCCDWLSLSAEDMLLICLFFPFLATLVSNRLVLNHKSTKLNHVEWIYLLLFNSYLGIYALGKFDFLSLSLTLSFFIAELGLAYLQSEIKYHRLAKYSLGIFIFLRFFEFFTSINWMIYLIVFGIGFVLIAMKQEAATREKSSTHSSNVQSLEENKREN